MRKDTLYITLSRDITSYTITSGQRAIATNVNYAVTIESPTLTTNLAGRDVSVIIYDTEWNTLTTATTFYPDTNNPYKAVTGPMLLDGAVYAKFFDGKPFDAAVRLPIVIRDKSAVLLSSDIVVVNGGVNAEPSVGDETVAGLVNAIRFYDLAEFKAWLEGTKTRDDGLSPGDIVVGQWVHTQNDGSFICKELIGDEPSVAKNFTAIVTQFPLTGALKMNPSNGVGLSLYSGDVYNEAEATSFRIDAISYKGDDFTFKTGGNQIARQKDNYALENRVNSKMDETLDAVKSDNDETYAAMLPVRNETVEARDRAEAAARGAKASETRAITAETNAAASEASASISASAAIEHSDVAVSSASSAATSAMNASTSSSSSSNFASAASDSAKVAATIAADLAEASEAARAAAERAAAASVDSASSASEAKAAAEASSNSATSSLGSASSASEAASRAETAATSAEASAVAAGESAEEAKQAASARVDDTISATSENPLQNKWLGKHLGATDQNSIQIGYHANAGISSTSSVDSGSDNGNQVAIGTSANAGDFGTAIGRDAYGTTSGVAVGYSSSGHHSGAAVGRGAKGYSGGAAVGYYAEGYGNGAAVGSNANGSTSGAAVGYQANGYYYGTAVGDNARGDGFGSAVGRFAKGYDFGAAVGYYANGSSNGVAVGSSAEGYTNGVAVGVSSLGINHGVSVGEGSYGSDYCVSIGFHAKKGGYGTPYSITIGPYASTSSQGAIAIGKNASASGTDAVAIGENVHSQFGALTIASGEINGRRLYIRMRASTSSDLSGLVPDGTPLIEFCAEDLITGKTYARQLALGNNGEQAAIDTDSTNSPFGSTGGYGDGYGSDYASSY